VSNKRNKGLKLAKWVGSVTILFAAMASAGQLYLAPQMQAGTIRHDRVAPSINDPANPHIQLANEIQFEAVGNYGGVNAVFIGGDWALTAAHTSDAGVFIVGGNLYNVIDEVYHPNWDQLDPTPDFTLGFDIKLIQLNTAVVGVNPALIYGSNNELGQVGTYVGLGRTGTGLTGAPLNIPPPGIMRAGNNVVDVFGANSGAPNSFMASADPSSSILLADFDSPAEDANTLNSLLGATSSPVPLDLEYSIADRDSGGGTFVNFGGQWRLVGIHSFIANGNGTYGTIAADTRVSSYTDWIFATTGIAPTPVPFEFNATTGLIALGILTGGYRILGLLFKGGIIKGLGRMIKKLPKP
jgi:hypothetical protein